MGVTQPLWRNPAEHIGKAVPIGPVLYMSAAVLQATARRFLAGFPGLVSYAVKANDAREVLENLSAAGISAFDVASPAEMRAVRAALPDAVLHYNNPVRATDEIAAARALRVTSYAVDCPSELAKLAAAGLGRVEVAVRLKLPVTGAAYDFGSKFGATPDAAVALLTAVAAAGFRPAMTFHPGTQCTDPAAWTRYIETSAAVAEAAGVRLERLNVGGGFPSQRGARPPDLERIFAAIRAAADRAFVVPPVLLCEPGRAMVAEAFSLASRVRAVRGDGAVFLDDGIYGGLAESAVLGVTKRVRALSPRGRLRAGACVPRVVFGPTCDSLDRLPGEIPLPASLAEGDWLLFEGLGAYSSATVTRFNGYGDLRVVSVAQPTL